VARQGGSSRRDLTDLICRQGGMGVTLTPSSFPGPKPSSPAIKWPLVESETDSRRSIAHPELPALPPPAVSSDRLATWSLVLAISGFWLWLLGPIAAAIAIVAILLGIAGLVRTRDGRPPGRGRAIAAIAIGSLQLLWLIAVLTSEGQFPY
jgi:hypothetical protein